MKRTGFWRDFGAVLGLLRADLSFGAERICAADKQNGSVNLDLNSAAFAGQICCACSTKSAVNLNQSQAKFAAFTSNLRERQAAKTLKFGSKFDKLGQAWSAAAVKTLPTFFASNFARLNAFATRHEAELVRCESGVFAKIAAPNLSLHSGQIDSVNLSPNSAAFASQIWAAHAVKSAVNSSSNSRARLVKFDASLNPREISQKTSLGAKTATNLATNLTANLARKFSSPVFAIFVIFAFTAALRAEPRPTQDDFNACFEKNLPAMVNVAGNGGIAITPNLIAVPKGETPVKNYVKFDPYLGLYLVASDAKQGPARLSDDNATKKSDWVSVTRELNATVYGHVKSQAQALGELDTLTFDVNGTGAVLSPCCKLRGIAVGGDKFVPSRYLRHFAAYKDVYYGDVGANFEQRDGKLFVKNADPLGRGAALTAGDEILSVNGEKFESLREINERILFAAKGERLKFEVKRGDEVLKFELAVSDDAVKKEQKAPMKDAKGTAAKGAKQQPAPQNADAASVQKLYGLTFDEKLNVKSVDAGSGAAKFGVRVGDKLMQVGQKTVSSRKEALGLLAKNGGQSLLFRRNGFDFFYSAK